MSCWLWREQATEKGDIESKTGWKNHSFILRKAVSIFLWEHSLIVFLGWMWRYTGLHISFPITRAQSEYVFTALVVYYLLRRSETKTVDVYCDLVLSLSILVQIPKEKGCGSRLSKVALWQVRHEDSVFCSYLLTNHGPLHLLLPPSVSPSHPTPPTLHTLTPALYCRFLDASPPLSSAV